MAIDLDEVKKKIAVRNDVLVGKDDPIMILATMMDEVLEQSLNAMNAQHEANLKATLNAVQQGNAEGKKAAERVITGAAEYLSDHVNNAVTAAIAEGREELRKDLAYSWVRIEGAKKASLAAMCVSVACALVSLSALWLQ